MWEMTGIIFFLGVGFCIAQKINHCAVFGVCYLEKKITVEATLQSKEDFGNERRLKRYLNMSLVSHRDSFTAWKDTERDNTLGVLMTV